jgi:hypothetical protein
MSIQSTLTLAIEVIFNLFIGLMIFDLINGLWIVPLPPVAFAQPSVLEKSQTSTLFPQIKEIPDFEQLETQPVPFIAPQFDEIPDPWTLEPALPNSTFENQSVVLTWTTLRLLPPVQEIKPKRSKNQHKATSTKKPKSAPGESSRKPGRPKKVA